MKFLTTYSNGWGHVLITVCALIFCAVILIFSTSDVAQSLAISMATLMIGYWFGAGNSSKEKNNTAGSPTIIIERPGAPAPEQRRELPQPPVSEIAYDDNMDNVVDKDTHEYPTVKPRLTLMHYTKKDNDL